MRACTYVYVFTVSFGWQPHCKDSTGSASPETPNRRSPTLPCQFPLRTSVPTPKPFDTHTRCFSRGSPDDPGGVTYGAPSQAPCQIHALPVRRVRWRGHSGGSAPEMQGSQQSSLALQLHQQVGKTRDIGGHGRGPKTGSS